MSTFATRPWLRFYGRVPESLDYPEVTLYEAVAQTAARVPDAIAWDFLDTTSSYAHFLAAIDRCADALASLGLKCGDRMLVSMPTSPQGIIAFYAASKLGAVPAMIHPLSAAPEIEHYLDASGARIALTLDAFYRVFAALKPKVPLDTMILARISDYLSPLKKLGFWLTKGRKIPRVPVDPRVRWWADLMAASYPAVPSAKRRADDPAAILFSGGTTGVPKGIVLSSRNFIAEGMQAARVGRDAPGRVDTRDPADLSRLRSRRLRERGVHGGRRNRFSCRSSTRSWSRSSSVQTAESAGRRADALRRARRDPSLASADLSCLHAAFSGADTLPRPVKERFEKLVAERGGNVRLLEGYGLTEAVTAIMATPLDEYREGSIGVPVPRHAGKDLQSRAPTEEAAVGEEGEICIAGPAVMLGYLDDPEATAEALRKHADGRVWLHTGDLGKMDADGFFYFTVRLKRMIKSSGFNVYPAQVEAVLYQHPVVAEACVVGVPDPSQVERVKAYRRAEGSCTQASAATEAGADRALPRAA